MTSISGLSAITSAIGPVAPKGVSDLAGATTGDTQSTTGSSFASQLAGSIQNLQNLQSNADELAVKAATGSLTDVHDYTIAATEASLATKLTVAVRDKAVGAFNEIMRMQG